MDDTNSLEIIITKRDPVMRGEALLGWLYRVVLPNRDTSFVFRFSGLDYNLCHFVQTGKENTAPDIHPDKSKSPQQAIGWMMSFDKANPPPRLTKMPITPKPLTL